VPVNVVWKVPLPAPPSIGKLLPLIYVGVIPSIVTSLISTSSDNVELT
jgi:hypothetical protein